VYTAEAANLAGAGLLAVRDAACWLRQPSAINLLQAPAVRTSFLFSDLPFFAPMKNDDLPRQARDKWKVRCHHPENSCLFA
jgi:hypothetical protein